MWIVGMDMCGWIYVPTWAILNHADIAVATYAFLVSVYIKRFTAHRFLLPSYFPS